MEVAAGGSLLGSISEFCRRTGMAESTFGRRAVNDGKFVSRLRDGARVTPETLQRVNLFMVKHGAPGAGGGPPPPPRPPAPPRAGTSAAERYQRYRQAARRPVLAVTLLSDGFFFDDYLRTSFIPSIEDLVPLGVDPAEWSSRPFQAFTDVRRVFGFDGEPVNLPRPHRLAVAAGSAFLFEARGEPRAPEGTGIGWIGDGRREGYGRAVLWHPFHLEPDPGSAIAEDPP